MEMREYLDTLKVYDVHEHLPYPVNGGAWDYSLLHYAKADLQSACPGAAAQDAYPSAFNTAYLQAVSRFAKDLFQVDLNEPGSFDRLEKLAKDRLQDADAWYHEVLRDRCRIHTALTIHDGSDTRHAILRPMLYLDFLLRRSQVQYLSQQRGHEVSFEEYVAYVDEWLENQLNAGAVAGKFGTPYWRDMDFQPADEAEARREFNLRQERSPKLEGYLFYRILDVFEKHGKPVQFHTGHVEPLSADMRNYRLDWSDPSPFLRIAAEKPGLSMVLLHTGFPFSHAYFSMIKSVPNLYGDFTWIYLLSPTLAAQNLRLALELVPLSKLMGFGGDACCVEMTYAHLQMAKDVLARVLTECVKDGWFTQAQAQRAASMLLYENAARLFGEPE